MAPRYHVFVSSLGRTGTLFLGRMSSRFIEDCVSLHEPDIYDIAEPGNLREKLRNASLARLLLGKLHPGYSMATLGVHRAAGRVSRHEAVATVQRLRRELYESHDEALVLESNLQFCLLLDVLIDAFPHARAVYIVRDPRTWIESWTRYASRPYSRFDVRSWFPHTRLKPWHVGDHDVARRWKHLTQFERISWYWSAATRYVEEQVRTNERIRIFRYEDLFVADDRIAGFEDMLAFVTASATGPAARYRLDPEALGERLHAGRGGTERAWTAWSARRARRLEALCGAHMRRWGYGDEPEWRRLVA